MENDLGRSAEQALEDMLDTPGRQAAYNFFSDYVTRKESFDLATFILTEEIAIISNKLEFHGTTGITTKDLETVLATGLRVSKKRLFTVPELREQLRSLVYQR